MRASERSANAIGPAAPFVGAAKLEKRTRAAKKVEFTRRYTHSFSGWPSESGNGGFSLGLEPFVVSPKGVWAG